MKLKWVEISMESGNGKEIRLWRTALCQPMWTSNITPTEIKPLYRRTMLCCEKKKFLYWQRKFITHTQRENQYVDVEPHVLNVSCWCYCLCLVFPISPAAIYFPTFSVVRIVSEQIFLFYLSFGAKNGCRWSEITDKIYYSEYCWAA